MENQRPLTPAENGGQPPPARPAGIQIYSNAVLLRHESAEAFAAHHDSYYQRFIPANRPESDLVDQMIAATWRIRRLAALESAAVDHTIDTQRATLDSTYSHLDNETRTHLAFDRLHIDSGTMTSYQRMQAAQVRNYDRAHRNLQVLQGQKKKERS